MEKSITDIIESIAEIHKDVYDYITSTEHWLYYWISNKEVQDFIEKYPENFEDMIFIEIKNLGGNSCVCHIKFEDHPYVYSIERFCVLATFRDSVKAKWIQWNGKIKEMKIASLKEDLEHYKDIVKKTEEKIMELENTESKKQ